MVSMRCSFTIFSTALASLTSRLQKYPPSSSSLSGWVLCPAAITFSLPYLFRKAVISSDPICPVAPVTSIRFMVYPLSPFQFFHQRRHHFERIPNYPIISPLKYWCVRVFVYSNNAFGGGHACQMHCCYKQRPGRTNISMG